MYVWLSLSSYFPFPFDLVEARFDEVYSMSLTSITLFISFAPLVVPLSAFNPTYDVSTLRQFKGSRYWLGLTLSYALAKVYHI